MRDFQLINRLQMLFPLIDENVYKLDDFEMFFLLLKANHEFVIFVLFYFILLIILLCNQITHRTLLLLLYGNYNPSV